MTQSTVTRNVINEAGEIVGQLVFTYNPDPIRFKDIHQISKEWWFEPAPKPETTSEGK